MSSSAFCTADFPSNTKIRTCIAVYAAFPFHGGWIDLVDFLFASPSSVQKPRYLLFASASASIRAA